MRKYAKKERELYTTQVESCLPKNLEGTLSLSGVMIDLTSSTFTVPLVDYSSPFAFSIINEVHLVPSSCQAQWKRDSIQIYNEECTHRRYRSS